MPIRHAIWKVAAQPAPLAESSLATERKLEVMIVAAPQMLSDEWMLSGRQEDTGYGGRIDLLALAPDGALILIELKRDRTPREVVAQALDYASWVEKLRPAEIAAIYGRFAPGRELGHDLEDWFRAETELIRHIPVEIKDTNENIIVRAEVPGFSANDLRISVDARQLILSGKVETTTVEKDEQAVYNERRSQQFYRTLTLPTDVDATKAITSLRDGVLELTLPKTAKPAAINVTVNPTT